MDDEEYINLEDLVVKKKKLYQIQLNNDVVIIKNIGYGLEAPEMIIEENVGINNNLNIYNCILTEEELEDIKDINEITSDNLFYPIIKLTEKIHIDDNSINNIYILSIKLKNEDDNINKIELEREITMFEIYLILREGESGLIKYKKLEKNINSKNIIEVLIKNFYNYSL
jgi:hypothetical protein